MAEYEIHSMGEGKITEKKSTFIGVVAPAHSEEEALAFIAVKKKEYYDARHNCFAYITGDHDEYVRSSDDGEPSGTAGRPILDVMTGHNLHHAVLVVTRYFGGILLGTGGLVRAYSKAAEEAIQNSTLLMRQAGVPLDVAVDYAGLGKVQYLLNEEEIFITGTDYDVGVTIHAMIPTEKQAKIQKALTDQTAGQAQLTWGQISHYGIADGKLIRFEKNA